MSLQEIATNLLLLLAKMRSTPDTPVEVDGETLTKITNISPTDINDAIALLRHSGYVEWLQYFGTAPYEFGQVWITPVGRYEAERISSAETTDKRNKAESKSSVLQSNIALPPTPIGSPFGFNDEDWEFIARQKDVADQLMVVLGYQFKSNNYDSELLRENVRLMFEGAVKSYNSLAGSLHAKLVFRPLAAGYGEHLFNEIARDIIASDIAVFDTSDLNPNVMVELGVALTWGIRVLPIKLGSQPRPPSDISGQTWADYEDNARIFVDPEHSEKLLRMVERAMRKKGHQ